MRRSLAPDEQGTVNVAFVLLTKPGLPAGEAVVREFAAFSKEGRQLKFPKPGPSEAGKAILSFELDPCGLAFVALVSSPVPNGEADEAARFSFSHIYEGWTLPPHNAHLLVTLTPTLNSASSLTTLSCMTSLLAAVSKASDAVGIYMGDAGATHDPQTFQTMAQRPQLGAHMTLERCQHRARGPAPQSAEPRDAAVESARFADDCTRDRGFARVARHVLRFVELRCATRRAAARRRHGESRGGERVPVHYVPSPLDENKQVWRIDLK